MARQYGRFDDVVIGPGLLTTDGGFVATTTTDSTSLARVLRSSFARTAGSFGAEFVFWGDGAMLATIGLAAPAAPMTLELGDTPSSIGWRLHSGEIRIGGAVVVSGLPAIAKGEIVGVQLFFSAGGPTYTARFFRGETQVAEVNLSTTTWHYAVSLASAVAGELNVAVNAGQWPPRSAAARSGWPLQEVVIPIVRIADFQWLSGPGDSPAHTRYEARLSGDGIDIVQALGFWPWRDAVAPRQGGAQMTVHDPDGALAGADYFEAPVSIRSVPRKGTLAEAEEIARFVVDGIEAIADGLLRVRLRDAHDALDEPVNSAVFLPYVPALAWQPQPVVIGAVASAPLLSANSDGTVGFVADAPLADIDLVMDRGDILEPGTWSLAPGGQQVLLESPPLGPVLADVSSVGAGMAPSTLAEALHAVFSRRGFGAWEIADAEAIDAASGHTGIGYYLGSEVRSLRQVRDALLASYCASAWQDAEGVLRFVRLVDPDTVSPELDLQPALLDGDMTWVYDDAPNLSRRMGYRPNAQQMSAGDFVTDLVDVPMSRRAELMQPFRGIVYSSVPMHPRYDAADRREPVPSGFWLRDDAQREIDRVCMLYAVERRFYAWTGELAQELRVGQVVRVVYDRYGLEAGRNMLVVSIQRNRAARRATIRLWGA